MSKLNFLNLHVLSYAGISKKSKAKIQYPKDAPGITDEFLKEKVNAENGIVIFFPPDYPIVQLEGNQGLGKTSLANAIVELGGGDAPVNAKNTDDNDKKVYARFYGKDGNLYDVSITRSGVTLYQIETNKDGKPALSQKGKETRMEVSSPKTKLAEIVGPTGISPLRVAELEPKKQIEWIRSLYKLSQEALEFESDLNQKLGEAFKARTDAGRITKEKDAALKENDYFKNREEWQNKLIQEDGAEDESQRIANQNSEYINAQAGLQQLREHTLPYANQRITTTDDAIIEKQVKITELERQIALLKADIGKLESLKERQVEDRKRTEKRIADGEKWLKDNKHIPEAYANISKKMQEKADRKMHKAEFDRMLQLEKEYNHFSDEYVRLTNKIDEYRAAKRKFIEQFSPEIKNFEVCVPDDEERREGLFYKGKPLSHLSESQQWEWFTMLCKQVNIQIIVVENINSLGSDSIAKFNQFAKKGAYIFATMMNRAEKDLTITFNMKIPE